LVILKCYSLEILSFWSLPYCINIYDERPRFHLWLEYVKRVKLATKRKWSRLRQNSYLLSMACIYQTAFLVSSKKWILSIVKMFFLLIKMKIWLILSNFFTYISMCIILFHKHKQSVWFIESTWTITPLRMSIIGLRATIQPFLGQPLPCQNGKHLQHWFVYLQ